jgi:hypothetical protein
MKASWAEASEDAHSEGWKYVPQQSFLTSIGLCGRSDSGKNECREL